MWDLPWSVSHIPSVTLLREKKRQKQNKQHPQTKTNKSNNNKKKQTNKAKNHGPFFSQQVSNIQRAPWLGMRLCGCSPLSGPRWNVNSLNLCRPSASSLSLPSCYVHPSCHVWNIVSLEPFLASCPYFFLPFLVSIDSWALREGVW